MLLSVLDTVPIGHKLQLDKPATDAKVPMGHNVHDVEPGNDEK